MFGLARKNLPAYIHRNIYKCNIQSFCSKPTISSYTRFIFGHSNNRKNNNKKSFSGKIKYGIGIGCILLLNTQTKKVLTCEDNTENETEIYNTTKEQYDKLQKVIGKFLGNCEYVYKSCYDDKGDKWLIVLKRTPTTITNEKRNSIVDAPKAKHRGNEFEVIMIVNINNPNITLDTFTNKYNLNVLSSATYTVGKIVKPEKEFCNDLERVCESGIHFFIDVLRAISYNHDQKQPQDFNGIWIKYHDNGKIEKKYNCRNGKQI
jgi:hypothetical protein